MPSQTFRSRMPALVASTLATILMAVLGAKFLGKAGTVTGLAIGSAGTSTASFWIERGMRRSADLARAKAQAVKRKGAPLSPDETQKIERVVDARHKRTIPWKWIAAGGGVIAAASVVVILSWQAAAGQTVAQIVRYDPPPSAPATIPAVSTSPSRTPSGSPSASLQATPTATSATPSAPATPTFSPAPSSPAPAVTPSSPAPSSPVPDGSPNPAASD